MKRMICSLLTAGMLLSLTGCHHHTPSAAATCTEPQICLECEKILEEALGHDPGPEATCAAPQVCLRCGEVLAEALPHTPGAPAGCTQGQVCTVCGAVLQPALGHSVGADGICTRCHEQIVEPGQTYIAPGKGSYTDVDASGVVPETQNSGHYTNDIAAYYANAVLVCGDYGVEYFTPDPTGSSGYAAIVNDFAACYPQVNVTALIVPKCCAFETPSGYEDAGSSIQRYIDSTYGMMDSRIKTADSFSIMAEHAGEYMFYRTDHHWTSLGAYYASVAYCEANGITPRPLDSYESVIRGDVTGTLYMYSGNDGNLKRHPDYTVCRFPAVGYSMQCYNDSTGWYNGIAVNGSYRDYAYAFINGDNALSVITSDLKNGRTLLVFKESYGNAFVPYMIDYYQRVVVVDIREGGESTAALMDRYDVTDVLFINNAQAASSFQSTLRTKALS